MTPPSIRNATVIGTGMMGPGIAAILALGGVPVTILSRSAEGASKGLESAQAQISILEENSLVSEDQVQNASIDTSTDFERSIAQTDLVIESAVENMEFKQQLFARMDAIARANTILASNTSGLSITSIASRCSRPERILTTHFWNPPHLMPLVEIVKGERTSAEVADRVRHLLHHCGKIPVIVKKDRPGQLGNRLQMALVREAVNIVAEGIADVEDVDLAAKMGFGLRLPVYGIFEHQDAVGLDMGLTIVDYVAADLYNEPHAPDLYRQKVQDGNLGAKTGRGFYDWSKKNLDEVKKRRDQFVLKFLKERANSQPY